MYWHKQTGWLCNMLFGGMLSTPAGLGNEQQDFPTSEQEELQGSTDASVSIGIMCFLIAAAEIWMPTTGTY